MNFNSIICVDIGGTETIIAELDKNLNICKKESFHTDKNLKVFISKLKEKIIKFDDKCKTRVGISLCGLLTKDGEKLITAPNLGWKNIDVRELFKPLNREFVVCNDGTSAAWGSYVTENVDNANRFLTATLGTGVGGGIVIDGNLLFGAGELGHIKINPQGPECSCGRRGCLEAYVGGENIPKQAKKWFDLDVKTAKELFKLAEKGSEEAVECWKRIGYILGYALAGVVNLNGIDLITLGGSITNARKYFFDEMEKSLLENIMDNKFQKCKIMISQWQHNISLIGVGALLLKPPSNFKKYRK
ncbi:MAG: ROK family protein [Elusimicrobiota bacterium]